MGLVDVAISLPIKSQSQSLSVKMIYLCGNYSDGGHSKRWLEIVSGYSVIKWGIKPVLAKIDSVESQLIAETIWTIARLNCPIDLSHVNNWMSIK